MQREAVIQYLERNGSCVTAEICKLLQTKESRTKELLRGMVADGILESIGANKNRVYRLQNRYEMKNEDSPC